MAGKSKYLEIIEEIEAKINSGEWPIGTQLPSEPELVDLFHYSRGTIRQALDDLARQGIVSRRSGSGTFIMRTPSSAKAGKLISMTAQIREAGLVPSTRFRRPPRQIMASEAGITVCAAFALDSEKSKLTPVYRIDRIRYGNGLPLAWQMVYLLASDFSGVALDLLKEDQSLYDLYGQYHRVPTWADEIIEAREPLSLRLTVGNIVDEEVDEADLLKIEEIPQKRCFVYDRERITFDSANIPIEYLRSVERSDFFRKYHYRIWEEQV
jgi:GntR family transcriptional regulator